MLMTTGNIFLSGGGDEKATQLLDSYFFKEVPHNTNILYVATGFRDNEKFANAVEWMQDMINMHGRSDLRFHMAYNLSGIKHLGDFSAVYVGGGDVDTLMDEFDRTGFEFVLKSYSEHGGTVYGGGGGSIVLGKFIDTRREIRRQFKTGVELLGRYSVFPGYRDENMDGWVSSHDSHLICVPDGIGVIIQDGKIIGDAGKAYKVYDI